MTQALNLANFANNLNTSGATTNAGLQNSSVTVTAGTGMSGGGAVALGSSVTLTNAGVTSIVAGTGISISGSTGAVTVNSTGGAGTVTSVATGNGLQGGTITSSGTLSLAAPSYNSVGSYVTGTVYLTSASAGTSGASFAAGSGAQQVSATQSDRATTTNNLSGTWRYMGGPLLYADINMIGTYVRIS